MKDHFKDLLSSQELARATGKQQRWIQSISMELIALGLARHIGRSLICHVDAIKYINTHRPETRGCDYIHNVQCWDFENVKYPGGIVTLKPGLSFEEGSHQNKKAFKTKEAVIKRLKMVFPCDCEICEINKI